jgi:hypothetical protein
MKKEYLGDGVYVSFDGYQIVLMTERAGHMDTIYLDNAVWRALFQYVERLKQEFLKAE